jgi:hypothetical protein
LKHFPHRVQCKTKSCRSRHFEFHIGNMNVHWMVLYKLYLFCSGMKFKMAATTGLSLTLDPMGKMFQNASSLKPLGQLNPNCPGNVQFVEDHLMNILVQFSFNHICSF